MNDTNPMKFTYYVPPYVHFGKDVCKQYLADAVKQYGKKVLLMIGIPKNYAYNQVVETLKDANIDWVEMSDIEPNPHITSVERGVKIAKENGCDVIVALGGGSTIDCAKGVSCAYYYQGDAWDLVLDWSKVKETLPILAVSTMPASGSEMGNAAVLSNPVTKEKLLLASNNIYPKETFLDPTFVYSLPRRQTAAGTADIFIHAMEEYFDSGDDAYLTDGICEAVMKTCVKYGRMAMDDPENYEARANLVWAAPLAINGLLNCGKKDGWTLHNTQHPLGGFYNVVHGEALAVLTPHWMRKILSDNTVDRFVKYGVNVFGIDQNKDKYEIANLAIEKTENWFFNELEIKRTLHELGVEDDSHFIEMATMALKVMGKQYVPLSIEETADLYRAAF